LLARSVCGRVLDPNGGVLMRFTEAEERHILERSGLVSLIGANALEEVRQRYQEPHRHYHDWHHALSVISWVNTVAESPLDRTKPALAVAALYHDAVYVVGAKDNEARSVALMSGPTWRATGGVAAHLIEATAHHGALDSAAVDPLTALFLDCDIATFGEHRWEVAKWHNEQVERELLQVYTPEQVAEGRRKFLGGLLAKRSIFLSDYFRTRFEVQARQNIARLIAEVA
jgi:predicted metal-dependent HD superfamily phosphohydrolase